MFQQNRFFPCMERWKVLHLYELLHRCAQSNFRHWNYNLATKLYHDLPHESSGRRLTCRKLRHVNRLTRRTLADCVQSVADLDSSREIFPRVTLGAHNPESHNSAVWRAAPRSSHALCRILATLATVIIPRIEKERERERERERRLARLWARGES